MSNGAKDGIVGTKGAFMVSVPMECRDALLLLAKKDRRTLGMTVTVLIENEVARRASNQAKEPKA